MIVFLLNNLAKKSSSSSTLLQREQEKYISLAQEHFLIFVYSLKIDHFDTKFIRDLSFEDKTHRIIVLLSSTLVRK